MSNALPDSDNYAESNESNDSAIQWVSFELLDGHDLTTEGQEEILNPIVEQIEDTVKLALRDAITTYYINGPERAADEVIETILDDISYDHVPDEIQDDVEDAVERRIREKHVQVVMRLEDIDAKIKNELETVGVSIFTDWGPVV